MSRLTPDERNAMLVLIGSNAIPEQGVRIIEDVLAEHMAPLEATIEAVRALADEWEAEDYPGSAVPAWNNGYDMRREVDLDALRDALGDQP